MSGRVIGSRAMRSRLMGGLVVGGINAMQNPFPLPMLACSFFACLDQLRPRGRKFCVFAAITWPDLFRAFICPNICLS